MAELVDGSTVTASRSSGSTSTPRIGRDHGSKPLADRLGSRSSALGKVLTGSIHTLGPRRPPYWGPAPIVADTGASRPDWSTPVAALALQTTTPTLALLARAAAGLSRLTDDAYVERARHRPPYDTRPTSVPGLHKFGDAWCCQLVLARVDFGVKRCAVCR